MASDGKKTKASPAPKSEPAAKDKTASVADASKAKGAETTATPDKAKDGEKPAASSYSRGEGQKPVSQAYKDNWDAIFAKKKKKR
jgi:hypothetical protein